MPRRRSPSLTDAELRVMNVLWRRGEANVGEAVQELPGPDRPAYNTVLTILRILEHKGYVTHRKEGRAFTFIPLIDRGEERRRVLSSVIRRFFDGSPALLVQDLLGHERVDTDEIRSVLDLIDQAVPAADVRPTGRRRKA
jgi:predicted transcriptional regulator